MATQLRPNWVTDDIEDNTPPPDLIYYGYLEQPVPTADQSVTIIRAWGTISNPSEDDVATVVFSCWQAGFVDGNFTATTRQIGDSYTVTVPVVAADADPTYVPFFLQWVDFAAPQAGMYMIAYDQTDLASGGVTDPLNAILSVAP